MQSMRIKSQPGLLRRRADPRHLHSQASHGARGRDRILKHHCRFSFRRLADTSVVFVLSLSAAALGVASPFERTEDRKPCASYDSQRKPLFGDTHAHSSYSFDS